MGKQIDISKYSDRALDEQIKENQLLLEEELDKQTRAKIEAHLANLKLEKHKRIK